LKKPAGSVLFRFYKQKIEKTEPNRNRQKTRKKPSQTEKNQAKTGKNRTKTKKTEPKSEKPSQTDFNLHVLCKQLVIDRLM